MRSLLFLFVLAALLCFPALADAANGAVQTESGLAGIYPILSLVSGVVVFALGVFHSLGASRAFSQHLRDAAAKDPKSIWSPIEVAIAQHVDAGDDVELAAGAKALIAAKIAAHGPPPGKA